MLVEVETCRFIPTTENSTTKIIIAQRITSIMDADRIIVMYNGDIVEENSTKELFDGPKKDYTKN